VELLAGLYEAYQKAADSIRDDIRAAEKLKSKVLYHTLKSSKISLPRSERKSESITILAEYICSALLYMCSLVLLI
jgi:hypothetical protein